MNETTRGERAPKSRNLRTDARFNGLRKASEQNWFPYKGIGPRSYNEVGPEGAMRQLSAVAELRAAIPKARAGEVALLAVWTEQYRSDTFYVDEIDALEAAGV